MAQPGNFTPILLYSSSTSTNVPLAANLTNSTNGAELAINIADKNLFFKDSGGTVNTVPIRQSSTSSNGWLSSTDWNTFNNKAPATSGTSLLYGNGSGGFSNVTIGSGISFAGGTLSATGSGGTVTSVTGTSPVVSSGGTTPAISLATAYGDTLNPYASKTANYILAAPNGSAGVPTFRALVAADVTGLGTMATQNANAIAITGGTINGTTIGATTATTGAFTTVTASTSLTTPTVQATNSAGLALKNSAGTTQISMGAGGGDNVTVAVSTNLNGTNAQIDISPTGTGHVHIKPSGTGAVEIAPTNAGTINNMVIGGTTPLAITGTTITATSFVGSGASLTSIPNSALVNSTISGVALGGSLFNLTAGTGVSFSTGTTYNGSTAITINATGTGGTVTSVAALTLGTTGTDLSSTVANGTTTPVITLNVPTASATNRGALSAADWSTFNGKQAALVSGTNIKTVGGVSLLGSGDVGTIGVAYGGTGQTTFTSGQLLFGNGTSGLNANSNFAVSAAKLTVLAGTSQQPMIQIQANSAAAGGFNRAFFKLRDSTGTNGWDIVEYGDDSNSLTFESYAASVGTEIVKLTSSGTLTLNGVSTAKSFVPTSNSAPTNGMYLPGTNILGFVTNATERLRIHASGGVSIGNTTDPGAGNLSVTGTAQATLFKSQVINTGSVAAGGTKATFKTGTYGTYFTGILTITAINASPRSQSYMVTVIGHGTTSGVLTPLSTEQYNSTSSVFTLSESTSSGVNTLTITNTSGITVDNYEVTLILMSGTAYLA